MAKEPMTVKAARFAKANDQSQVVDGRVLPQTEGGAQWTLADERVFRLSANDCRSLPEDYPKWKL